MIPCSPFHSREVEHFLTDQFEYSDNPNDKQRLLAWLMTTPHFTTLRVNTLKSSVKDVIAAINDALQKQSRSSETAGKETVDETEETENYNSVAGSSTPASMVSSPSTSKSKEKSRHRTASNIAEEQMATAFGQLTNQCEEYGIDEMPQVFVHPKLPETVVVGPWNVNELDLDIKQQEVIVDVACGVAVLRGADVFAPGVMGMQTGAQIGDIVSVFADVSKNCKKGLQCVYPDDQKYFVGNGIVRMSRKQLYGKDAQPTGVAVRMLSRPSGCPSVPSFLGMAILQNLPSILTCHALDLSPGHYVLDCCAAPGNKTLHIASLMNDKGRIVAVDKTQGKVNIIKRKCEEFSVKCVETYVGDTTKSVQTPDTNMCKAGEDHSLPHCPLFPPESFDRVLLDAPCSALGQRPQLRNDISIQQLQSYPILQRKLFKAAYTLLKPGGYLVYSTCTVNVAENEAIVGWALKAYSQLVLEPIIPSIGGPGIPHAGNLTEEQTECVQRFGPPVEGSVKGCDTDTVGFFIARFRKKVLHHR
ncbi:tRNA (cytosine(72)-C(5))-methyltransferase NSUN6 isoform X1 [Schistocerca cancellata]|uniref:tRNA (cytosine(72)-C(5))-methyltransferase NSUN6 isoform X1 n=2 Tax=Schistocerca cancellata TaxID=274614 RepID=UPI00211923FD|nr:tRNA (cytosine(72)-C(5))-methyltransferase NSUN6 isoform X1 [Schistocerca cancellata]